MCQQLTYVRYNNTLWSGNRNNFMKITTSENIYKKNIKINNYNFRETSYINNYIQWE